MWMRPPPPVADWWVLHIGATPHEVDDLMRELCVHKHAHTVGDPGYPAYVAGTSDPYEPPAWMSVVRTELLRRGLRTRWCTPTCPHDGGQNSADGPPIGGTSGYMRSS